MATLSLTDSYAYFFNRRVLMFPQGTWYTQRAFAAPEQERDKWLGHQADPAAAIKEARALMAAAGHSDGIKGLDFMVREIAIFKLWSQAIQAMLKESLNIECNLRTVVDSVWFADAGSGNYDLAIGGLVSALLDPSDYSPGTAKTGRRTIRSGATRNSRPYRSKSTGKSTQRNART